MTLSTTPPNIRLPWGWGSRAVVTTTLPEGRFGVFTTILDVAAPAAGGDVDGVVYTLDSHPSDKRLHEALPGYRTRVEVGTGGVSQGDDLATDGTGKAVVAGAGDVVVARALQTRSAGAYVWLVFV